MIMNPYSTELTLNLFFGFKIIKHLSIIHTEDFVIYVQIFAWLSTQFVK